MTRLILACFFFFTVINCWGITETNDTLLVYFSDDKVINQQYYDILAKKFGGTLQLKMINDSNEFFRHIPKHLYDAHRSEYSKTRYVFSTISSYDTKRRQSAKQYFFFDIETVRWLRSVYNGPNYGMVDDYTKDYYLSLNYCTDTIITKRRLTKIHVKPLYSNKNRPIINIGELDFASEYVNPVLIAMYIYNYKTPSSLIPEFLILPTVLNIKTSDTIYVSMVLDIGSESKKQHKFFKHTHINLNNFELGERFTSALDKNLPFYFYFYDETYKCYYIINGLDFNVEYFMVGEKNYQMKKEIEIFTGFLSP